MKIILSILMVVLCLTVISVFLESIPFKITAYCEGTITKTGKNVAPGMCAVDPRVIRLGSTVYIKGLGMFKAEDIGGKVKGRVIDIYIPDCNKAEQFGVQWARIKIRR